MKNSGIFYFNSIKTKKIAIYVIFLYICREFQKNLFIKRI